MRTVFVEKKEAEAFAKVQQAWDAVQAAWKSGTITGMKEAYQTLLGGSFELAKFSEPYAEIRKVFSEGLQSRLGQVLGQAEASIAEYLAFLFQVDDPSLSGSYRSIGGTAPKVAFELPPIADLKDLNLGFRTSAWCGWRRGAGPPPGWERTGRAGRWPPRSRNWPRNAASRDWPIRRRSANSIGPCSNPSLRCSPRRDGDGEAHRHDAVAGPRQLPAGSFRQGSAE